MSSIVVLSVGHYPKINPFRTKQHPSAARQHRRDLFLDNDLRTIHYPLHNITQLAIATITFESYQTT